MISSRQLEKSWKKKSIKKSEQVFTAKTQLLDNAKTFNFLVNGEALVNEFIKQHIDQITLFRSLIVNGIEYDPITEKRRQRCV